MKTFSSILESLNPEMKVALLNRINTLGQWLYKSDGLGMMDIIDKIFEEQNYTQKIGFKQIAKFNQGLDILKKTKVLAIETDEELAIAEKIIKLI